MSLKKYKVDPKRLRSRHTGNYLLDGLFYERCKDDMILKDTCVFTLALEDNEELGLYSFPKLYLSIDDPTEYKQAIEILGAVEHWDKVVKLAWLKPTILKLRSQLKRKMRSDAFGRIHNAALTSESDAVRMAAEKFIIKEGARILDEQSEEEQQSKAKKGRGRPSSEEIEGELKRFTAEERQLIEDSQRVLNGRPN